MPHLTDRDGCLRVRAKIKPRSRLNRISHLQRAKFSGESLLTTPLRKFGSKFSMTEAAERTFLQNREVFHCYARGTIWYLVGLELTQRERNICGISVDNHLGRSVRKVTWNGLLPKRPFYPTIWYEPDSRNEHIESECSWRAEEGERNGRDIEQNRRNPLEVAAQRDRQV